MSWLCALWAVAALPAQQVAIGSTAPKLIAKRWLVRGDTAAENQVPRLLCFVPSTRLGYRRSMAKLCALQGVVGKRLAVIAVLPTKSARELMTLRYGRTTAQASVVVDRADQTRAAYSDLFAEPFLGVPAVLIDANHELHWYGPLAADLRYLVEDMSEQRFDRRTARALDELNTSATIARRSRTWRKPLEMATKLAREFPGHWLAHAVQIEAVPAADLKTTASELWRAAGRSLKQRPEYLARVLGLALERNPALSQEPAFIQMFGTVRLADPSHGAVARACFEYYNARGEDRTATPWAFRWLECAKPDPRALVELAKHLGGSSNAGRYADVSLLAYDLALRSKPSDSELLYAKFEILILHKRDAAGADRVGRQIVEAKAEDARFLNSFAWRLLTESPYKKHLASLALYAGEQMAENDDWRAYWRVDTLALAMFANGRCEDAVVLQRDAVASCDTTSRARYQQRLERYERGRAQQLAGLARPAAKPGK